MNKLLVLLLIPFLCLSQKANKKIFYFDQHVVNKVMFNSETRIFHYFTNSKDSTYHLDLDNGLNKSAILFLKENKMNYSFLYDFDFTFFNYKQLSQLRFLNKLTFNKNSKKDFQGYYETFEYAYDSITNELLIHKKFYKNKKKKKIIAEYKKIFSNKRSIPSLQEISYKKEILTMYNLKIPDDYFSVSTIVINNGKITTESKFVSEEKIELNFEVTE